MPRPGVFPSPAQLIDSFQIFRKHFAGREARATQSFSLPPATDGDTTRNESDWLDEKRNVLNRLFDAAFERSGAPGDETKRDIHRLATAV